jgi:PAS domain S-box-containing protein
MTLGGSEIQKKSGIRYVRKMILISLGSLLLIVNLASGQQPKETKRVLILITGQMDVPGYELSRKGMHAALDQSTDFHFEYFIEYIDWYRFKDKSYEKDLLDLYRKKYSDKKIDLLIAHGYHALRLVAAYRQDFLPHVPVVFSTVLKRQVERLDLDKKFAGGLAEIEFEGLLNTALSNHPDTRHVAIISGTSIVGRLIEKEIRAAYAAHADKYDFIYLGHLAMKDLLDRLAKLPDHTIVIYYILMLDGAQKEYKPWKVAGMVSEAANAPVYGMADTYMGEGIVGGKLWSYEALGTKSGEIALRILKGENPADIPLTAERTNINIFDWRQLKRWGINESNLPEGSIVRYKEWSFWDLYRWYIIGGIFLLFFQGFFISVLLVQRKRGKQTEQSLRASDERFRAYMQNSTEQIWCAEFDEPIDIDLPEDEQFELVYKHVYMAEANDAYARSVGLEHGEQLIGTRIGEFCPRSDPNNVATVKAWIRGHYNITDAETTESYKDGVTRTLLNNSRSVIEAGRVVRVWGTATDITDRKAAEKALVNSEKQLRLLTNALPALISYIDRDDRYRYTNRAYERWFGTRMEENFGRLHREVLGDELHKKIESFVKRALAGETVNFEMDLIRDGKGYPFEASYIPDVGSDGEVQGFYVLAHDVSARKQKEAELQKTRDQLAHFSRVMAVGEIASSVAHELNQPLSAIRSYAQAAQRYLDRSPPDIEETGTAVRGVVAGSRRADEVIQRIRAILKKEPFNRSRLDVKELIQEVIMIVRRQAEDKKILLRTDIPAGLPPVFGDRLQLQQVLLNLIFNGFEAMADGEGGSRELVVRAAQDHADAVTISVRDSGIGITDEVGDHLFDAFFTTKRDGLGMGLSISRTIVEENMGRLWCAQNPDKGTTFYYTVPIYTEDVR